jgi:hypothetical protein
VFKINVNTTSWIIDILQPSELSRCFHVKLLNEEVDEGERNDESDEDRTGVGDGDDGSADLETKLSELF